MNMVKTEQTDFQSGHRKRIKERFLKTEGQAWEDYELLELLLTYSIPRIDVKPLAKTLLAKFGSLGDIQAASIDDLKKVKGIKDNTAILLKASFLMQESILKRETIKRECLNSWDRIENYCFALLGREKKEFVYLIMLDAGCHIIDTVQVQKGTVDQASVYIREIVELLIQNHALSFILVHNHPSGSSKPSPDDIHLTHSLQDTTGRLNIHMQDHFIVSPKGVNSFKMMGLMKKYDDKK